MAFPNSDSDFVYCTYDDVFGGWIGDRDLSTSASGVCGHLWLKMRCEFISSSWIWQLYFSFDGVNYTVDGPISGNTTISPYPCGRSCIIANGAGTVGGGAFPSCYPTGRIYWTMTLADALYPAPGFDGCQCPNATVLTSGVTYSGNIGEARERWFKFTTAAGHTSFSLVTTAVASSLLFTYTSYSTTGTNYDCSNGNMGSEPTSEATGSYSKPTDGTSRDVFIKVYLAYGGGASDFTITCTDT